MKMTLITILIFIFLPARSPDLRSIPIIRTEGVCPHEKLWQVTCQIESANDPFAIHNEENGFASVGISQIQKSRVDDFNSQTGSNYELFDMFNDEISKTVYMYFASKLNPCQIEEISRLWNGGPKGMSYRQTKDYWNQIKILL